MKSMSRKISFADRVEPRKTASNAVSAWAWRASTVHVGIDTCTKGVGFTWSATFSQR